MLLNYFSVTLQKLDYLHYLQSFDRLYEIPKEEKGVDYKRYNKCVSLILLSYRHTDT